jgi:hypothetical protein
LLEITTLHADQRSVVNVARQHARGQLSAANRGHEYDRLVGELVRWAGTDGARSGVYTFTSPSRDLLLADARAQAVPALADAALALLLGPELDPVSAEVLVAAWSSVIKSGERVGSARKRRARDINER